jgi:hypothetical protein
LKWAPETAPNIRMMVKRAAAVAAAFSNSWRPMSPGESCWAAIPEPITAAARKAEPRNSASRRRARGGFIAELPSSRGDQELVGVLARETGLRNLAGRVLGVIVEPLDPSFDPVARNLEDGKAASRIAVLGLPDGAAVDK